MLTRYNDRLETPMRRFLENVWNEPFFLPGWLATSTEEAEGNLALDVSEREDETIIRASLPGFKKEDIDVQFNNGLLTIKADRTEETEDSGETYTRRERRVESMHRSIRLPKVDPEGEVDAKLKNGVLELHLPHTEKSKPRQIEIK